MTSSGLRKLFLARTPLMDVRAPVEFSAGALPRAVNLPLMNNEERTLVGTTYKRAGREAAIRLGHELVSEEIRESRIEKWITQLKKQKETVLYCFRGGLRSQITQRWLAERGVHCPLIEGGYKKGRQFLREETERFSKEEKTLMLAGPTGSAKTHLLEKASAFYPVIDLEALAGHRGSAFGAGAKPQPNQIDFENSLAVRMMSVSGRSNERKILVEDESRLIGKCALPESLFTRMRSSDLIYVEESFEQRVENIFQDYILNTSIGSDDRTSAMEQFADYLQATKMISRKLGGARTQEVLLDLENSKRSYLKDERDLESNKVWIGKLLSYYYDPLYANSLARRNPKVLFKGSGADVLDYLAAHS